MNNKITYWRYWPTDKKMENKLTYDQKEQIREFISTQIDDSTDDGRLLRMALFSPVNTINWYYVAYHFSVMRPEYKQKLIDIIFNY